MQNMLVLYRFTVNTRQQQFEEQYKTYKVLQEGIPGNLFEMLTRSTNDPDSYLIVSIWQEKSFFSWLQSPAHDVVVNMLNLYKQPETQVARYIIHTTFQNSAIFSPEVIRVVTPHLSNTPDPIM